MSGLIWSALGQSVANAGTMIGAGMMKDLEEQRRLEAEDRREAASLRRLEEADRIKAEREDRRSEALRQRVAVESSEVERRAARVGEQRRDRALDADASRLAESSAQAGAQGDVTLSKEQLAGVLSQNPRVRDGYRREGLIEGSIDDRRDPRMVMADDRVQAAREIGAHSSVLESYSKDRRDILDEIRRENERARGDQQHAATLAAIAEGARRWDERRPIYQQNADARSRNADTNAEVSKARVDALRRGADAKQTGAAARAQDAATNAKREERVGAGKQPPAATSAKTSASGTKNYSNLWN